MPPPHAPQGTVWLRVGTARAARPVPEVKRKKDYFSQEKP